MANKIRFYTFHELFRKFGFVNLLILKYGGEGNVHINKFPNVLRHYFSSNVK